METTTLDQFYKDLYKDNRCRLPEEISKDLGHFNIFNVKCLASKVKESGAMPYNRRTYYKISLIRGRNKAEYADKVIDIEKSALLFATPRVPYHWLPQDEDQSGYFCIFTAEFLSGSRNGISLEELPIFQPGGFPVFQLTDESTEEINVIFKKMEKELSSNYEFKYDLIRNYVMELIHYGQKLQPVTSQHPSHTASTRVSSLFVELLERQFPIETPRQRLSMRTAGDYADRLSVHVNHLNKVLKETTGRTTTEIISSRILQEAKILLRQTNWNVSEIAWSLGFEEPAHFSNFFRKQTQTSPLSFRA